METREKLLISAQNEFLKYGYEKASLRTICKNVGLTTGALYFFFNNKEDLFESLVKKIAKSFKEIICTFVEREKENYKNILNDNCKYIDNSYYHIEHERKFMKYMYANKNAFILLAMKSQGSCYENYYDEVLQLVEGLFREFLEMYKGKTSRNPNINEYTIHCLVSWRMHSYINVLNSNLTLHEALTQAEVIANYAVGGWNRIMKNSFESLDYNSMLAT
ncbi:TetR/AcrR family transcriptional regulator [Clostridium botulinum]|uniref:TetR/AcrR family transcriptional regulator n=2 Tax=Clostridium TaxID=1485 RepID=A0AAU8YSS3_CLOBO|nr:MULTISPECIES: TetR/AcrR family transcriptional regulator [Clostridium]AVP59188.1 TetR/AcrR family transcriptional regulator [Clostridium botulinum]AKJ89702.1 TetR family transcriptional regulator [Clostridium sporogenes]AVP63451.1 TetR/AcrR family transcriptional regulator [Clostridium botulinum]KOY64851.1 TetR family transcriptional regulator [Clostridium sporogenes]MBA4508290.1 TetR/AcrR family transcriptional regulator [Clostridium sporogenes]